MNDDAIERLFADGLTGLAPARAPHGLGSTIKTSTSSMRPRPRWLALIKEPPMRLTSRVAVGSPTARLTAVMASTLALVLLLAAAAVAGATLLFEDAAADSGDWPMFKRDAARTGRTLDGPVGGPVLQWRYAADGSVSHNVSVVGDLVYLASDEGVLRAVGRADGLESWRYTTETPTFTGPSVVDDVVYAIDGSEVMVAIDAMTGAELWRSSVPLPGGANPTPADRVLLVGIATGELVAIDAGSGAEAWRAQVSPSGGAVRAPAYADGRAFVASEGGGFVALDTSTREILWRFDTGDAQTGTAGVIDGIAYIGGSGDGGEGLLWALDATTGEELWRIDEPIFTPAVADGVGYSGSASGLITAFDTATGAIRWQETVEGTARPLAVAEGIVYVPADGEQRVYALDAETGDELWRFDLDAGVDCCIAVAHGSVFVGTQLGSVYAIGGDGGEPPGPPQSAAPGGSTAPGGSAAQSAVSPDAPPVAFLPDGTYVAEVSVMEMDAAEAAFSGEPTESDACPCTHRFSIREGRWLDGDGSPIWFAVDADRVELYGAVSFRWSWDGRAVMFSDRQGGDPGDSLVFETKPFELQEATTIVDGSAFGQPFEIEIPSDGSIEIAEINPNVAVFQAPSSDAGLTLWGVEAHRSDPCEPSEGEAIAVADSDALIDFLKSIPQIDVIELEDVDLDGHPARVIDVAALEGPEGCGVDPIPWSAGGEAFSIGPGWTTRLLIADFDGDTIVLELYGLDLAPWLVVAQPVVESLRFLTATPSAEAA